MIENILEKYKPSILSLNEANIKKEDINNIKFQDYIIETDNLINTRGLARTTVIIHKDISYSRDKTLEPKNTSCVILKMGKKNHKKFTLINWYRQWNLTNSRPDEPDYNSIPQQLIRLKSVIDIWNTLTENGGEVITIGDINLNAQLWDMDESTMSQYQKRFIPLRQYLKENILDKNVYHLDTGLTWHQRNKPPESLDLVFSTHPSKLSKIKVISDGQSDHDLVTFTKLTKSQVHKPRYFTARTFKDFNKQMFEDAINNDPRFTQSIAQTDPNVATDLLQAVITEKLDMMAPLKRIQVKTNHLPYITDQTKCIQNNRDIAYNRAKDTDDSNDWRLYRNLRNQAVSSLRNDEYNYNRHHLNNDQMSPKELWVQTKRVLKWARSGTPRHLLHKGAIIDSPKEIANVLNDFYINKVQKIIDSIQPTNTDPMTNYKKLVGNRVLEMSFTTVSMQELLITISKMKSSTSTGTDNTSMRTIKQSLKTFSPAILNIVNNSITTNTFPESLKTSRIIPILKSKKEPSLSGSYRPINLIPWLSKIIENIIKNQITKHLDNRNLIPPQHNGGRKYHSTTSNAIILIDMWTQILDDNLDAVLIQLDQSAAYDVVTHDILLKKLKLLGLDDNACEYMKSYMTNRQQQVIVEGYSSEIKNVGNRSVMQGSVMSTLLYLIYVLDFPNLFHNRKHDAIEDFHCHQPTGLTFVDDMNITAVKKQSSSLQDTLMNTLETTSDYMKANKLAFNNDKTKIMAITKNINLKEIIKIPTEEEDITHQSQITILGIVVQDNMKLNNWIDKGRESLINQLKTRLSALKKIAPTSNYKLRKNLANGIFQSKLVYGIQVWGTAPKYLIQKIQVIQNNVARLTIGNKSKRWSQKHLMDEMNWLCINDLITFHTTTTIHQTLNTKTPNYMYKRMQNNQQLPTRSSAINKLGPKPPNQGNTTHSKNTFIPRSYEIYNNIPDVITAIPGRRFFRTKMKRYLKNKNDLPSINDPTYQKMIPDETLMLMSPNIDLSNKRKKRT